MFGSGAGPNPDLRGLSFSVSGFGSVLGLGFRVNVPEYS